MTTTRQDHQAWTSAGSDTAAQNTYASVRHALRHIAARPDIEIFLQGSYANTTNIRADSDVDVVVMTTQTFQGSIERLGPTSRAAWDSMPGATYFSSSLRDEVTAALVSHYGSSRVHGRNKCIQVDKTAGYVDADVVSCVQYRWYQNSTSNVHTGYVEGIAIEPLRGDKIINFPKEHIRNGKTKNLLCSGRYKETVRQIKRLRNRAVDEGKLPDGIAPGYLLECMTYNTPNDKFVTDDSTRLQNVVLWLKFAAKSAFMSCDGIHTLFGTDPGDFSVTTGQLITDALWEAY